MRYEADVSQTQDSEDCDGNSATQYRHSTLVQHKGVTFF